MLALALNDATDNVAIAADDQKKEADRAGHNDAKVYKFGDEGGKIGKMDIAGPDFVCQIAAFRKDGGGGESFGY